MSCRHVATSLVRSGVGRVRLVDFDLVTVSSLNRSSNARRRDVGKSKVAALREFLLEVNPLAKIEIFEEFLTKENQAELLSGRPNIVMDCIDDITTKVELIRYCVQEKLEVLVSGGAGTKADPTKMLFRDISESNCTLMLKTDCPLLRSVRAELSRSGIKKGITVLFSNEITERGLMPLNETQSKDPDEYRPLEKMRVRTVPVLGTMPSIFGQALATYALLRLAGETYK